MREEAKKRGLSLKVKESKAVVTTIEDLIDARSPLVPLTIASRVHHPTNSTTPHTVYLPSCIQRPQPKVFSARYTPLCPTPGIQLGVTTPDLPGQQRPNGSNEPLHESRQREINTPTSTTDPTSPVRAPNWHDPPRIDRQGQPAMGDNDSRHTRAAGLESGTWGPPSTLRVPRRSGYSQLASCPRRLDDSRRRQPQLPGPGRRSGDVLTPADGHTSAARKQIPSHSGPSPNNTSAA